MTLKPKTLRLFFALIVCCTASTTLRCQTNSAPTEVVTNKVFSSAGKWVRASNTNCLIWSSFPREGESVSWSGPVVDGKAEGKGFVQWFTNGIPTTTYEGELKGGRSDGHGTAKGYGQTLEGDWKDGCLLLKNMICHYPDGRWYKGENRDGFEGGAGRRNDAGGSAIRGTLQARPIRRLGDIGLAQWRQDQRAVGGFRSWWESGPIRGPIAPH